MSEDPSQYRKIIHVDMDAFYASVEQRDFPEYRGKPLAVGGSRERGVVAAASYEARKYGVHSAMPSLTAARLCPDIIFVKPRFERYKEVSRQIRQIFYRYTDLVEPLSLDEAYLDVTENKKGIHSATLIAREIRQAIYEETQLRASAGISINKFLAKVASDINKPNGLTLIPPDRAISFLESLPIEKFFGIGKVTAAKMKKMGIHTGNDLKQRSELELAQRFGKAGRHYYRIVRALDNRRVQPNRPSKSVSAENTFQQDVVEPSVMIDFLEPITHSVVNRLTKLDTSGRTVTLKIKYHDFTISTRSKTVSHYLSEFDEIFAIVAQLLQQPQPPLKPVRLLGVGISNLHRDEDDLPRQLTLEF